MEEITDAWEEARPTLINLALTPNSGAWRKRPTPKPNSKASSSSSHTLKRPRRVSGSQSPIPNQVARLDTAPMEDFGSDELEPPLFYDGQDDVEEELGQNDEGTCPLCSARMAIVSIPMHIERGCPPPKVSKANGAGNQKADWKKVFAGAGMVKEKDVEMKRILKPNYAMASPVELRAILTQYGLPTTGDKSTLESRVQEWIILFNSNLDTSHPRSVSALRAKLSEAEASRKRDREKGKEEMISQMGTKDGMARYVKDKKGEFERLRREIVERDKKKVGNRRESAIEVE